jgi:hypothetical protein
LQRRIAHPAHAAKERIGEIAANHRTGGVPLFVEEVTRLLLERGEQGGVQAAGPGAGSGADRFASASQQDWWLSAI